MFNLRVFCSQFFCKPEAINMVQCSAHCILCIDLCVCVCVCVCKASSLF